MKPDDDLLNQSTLTNDETELDPAVIAQFREYEKVIAALSAKVDNLTQLVQSNNKPEEQPVVTTSENTSAANNSNILMVTTSSAATQSHTTQCHTQCSCSIGANPCGPGTTGSQLPFNPQAPIFTPQIPVKYEPSSHDACKTPLGPLHQCVPAPSAPAMTEVHSSSETQHLFRNVSAASKLPYRG
ncbi:hypothetical protein TKK_0017501 [Trichogramma kaykai]|uniref:Uncharacterized protein n=1 Tax=Trichogramma kaykai TaxID=54128 RepID=A0ABD2W325_9HYME